MQQVICTLVSCWRCHNCCLSKDSNAEGIKAKLARGFPNWDLKVGAWLPDVRHRPGWIHLLQRTFAGIWLYLNHRGISCCLWCLVFWVHNSPNHLWQYNTILSCSSSYYVSFFRVSSVVEYHSGLLQVIISKGLTRQHLLMIKVLSHFGIEGKSLLTRDIMQDLRYVPFMYLCPQLCWVKS